MLATTDGDSEKFVGQMSERRNRDKNGSREKSGSYSSRNQVKGRETRSHGAGKKVEASSAGGELTYHQVDPEIAGRRADLSSALECHNPSGNAGSSHEDDSNP
jgi:hypothetical protein